MENITQELSTKSDWNIVGSKVDFIFQKQKQSGIIKNYGWKGFPYGEQMYLILLDNYTGKNSGCVYVHHTMIKKIHSN